MVKEGTLGSALALLESQAGKLNEISDEVNNKLTDVERRIVGMNVGLEFWYGPPVRREDSPGGPVSADATSQELVHVIGLAKIGGNWRLAVKPITLIRGFFQGDTNSPYENRIPGVPSPLLEASREIRIAALALMFHFVADLTRYVMETNEVIRKASG